MKDENDLEYTWSISELHNCPTSRTHLLGPTNIVLDYVKAVNVDIITRRGRHLGRISLSGVPKFLVDAFGNLEHKEAFCIDGIFRKEGNASRLKNAWTIYCGMSSIPDECTPHDVCSLIKRFFREIKTPIFDDCQLNILKFAESLNNDETVFKAISAVIERLPVANISALTFLLKQLKKVSEFSKENHMTIDNLATVFAPSLFRDETLITNSKKKKKDDQFHLMKFVRSRNNLQISVVKLLIAKSHCLSPPLEVKLSRHSSEHYSSSSKKIANETANQAAINDSPIFPAELATTTETKTFTSAASLKRSQSAKSSIQRVLSLRERPRNTNFTTNGIRYGATSVWHQKPRIAAALAARDVGGEEKKTAILSSVLAHQTHQQTSIQSSMSSSSRIPLVQNKSGLNSAASSMECVTVGAKNDDDVERTKSIGEEDLVIVQSLHSLKSKPPRPPPPKISDDGTFGVKSGTQAKKPLHHKQMVAVRRTREYASENEKICTYCDARGHLIKNCPNLVPWK